MAKQWPRITARWFGYDLAMFAQQNFRAYWARPIGVELGQENFVVSDPTLGGDLFVVALPDYVQHLPVDMARRVSRRVFLDLLGFD